MIKGQTKRNSTIEVTVNTISGFFIAMVLNLFLLPHFADGIVQQSITTAIVIGIIYTTASYIRSYAFRRFFNNIEGSKKTLKKQLNLELKKLW